MPYEELRIVQHLRHEQIVVQHVNQLQREITIGFIGQ